MIVVTRLTQAFPLFDVWNLRDNSATPLSPIAVQFPWRSAYMNSTLLCSTLALWLLWLSSLPIAGQVAVLTYHNDNYRSGLNARETILTPSNVNEVQFGKRLTLPVQGYVYAQPLYVPHVNINGTLHNVVYVATEHDQVYAFDVNSGALLWQKSFIGTLGNRQIETVSSYDVQCLDTVPEIGITGTPVIDLATNRLYVVAKTKEIVNNQTTYYQRLHVLDIRTGQENMSGVFFAAPITAKTPGTGAGSVDGYLYFNPLLQHQRPGLALANGTVYVAWASHCDNPPYHGYVMGFNANSARPIGALVTTPDGYNGGVWMSGAGPAVDTAGNVYVPTGNGLFDVNLGGADYGDSIVRLSFAGPFPAVADYFTPWDQAVLNAYDVDLGSGGILLLPDQPGTPHPHLLLQIGKEGTIDLVDRDNMGHFNPSGDNQIVQTLPHGAPYGVWGAQAMWNNTVYVGSFSSPITAFYYDPVAQQIQAAPMSTTPETFGFPGTIPSISASGNSNGIVWAIESDGFQNGSNAILRAYDATNLANELYNSTLNQARDQAGPAVKFAVPTIADGMVFVGAVNEVDVYGPLH